MSRGDQNTRFGEEGEAGEGFQGVRWAWGSTQGFCFLISGGVGHRILSSWREGAVESPGSVFLSGGNGFGEAFSAKTLHDIQLMVPDTAHYLPASDD